jgi:SAM-dependent methyltransferase
LPGRVARRVRLFQATLDDFRAGFRFDLAYCLVSTFKYLPDERSARLHLRRVASALAPGAVYVLGFHLSEYGWTSKSRERWVGEREGVRVVCNTQFWPPDRKRRRERVRARLTVEERGNTSRYETAWWFRTYDAGEVTRLIRAVPELEHVATYDFDYRIDRPRKLDGGRLDVVVVLRRRSRGPVGRAD